MKASEYPTTAAHQRSSNHRDEILRSDVCGCFHCLQTYLPSTITEWTDEVSGIGTTAFCPECGIDSVIGSASGFPITREFLEAMHRHWF